MKDVLTLADFRPLLEKLSLALEAAVEKITELDAAAGDGDLGVTCRLGMQAALQAAQEPPANLGEALLQAGMAFNSAGASTFGALVATAAMRAAKYAQDAELREWNLPAIIGAAEAAIVGLQQRGGAQQGDKTLLDALIPAVEALKAAQQKGASLAEALQDAAAAAQKGAEATIPLQAKFGRAGWLQERAIGVQDAGATIVALALAAVAEYAQT